MRCLTFEIKSSCALTFLFPAGVSYITEHPAAERIPEVIRIIDGSEGNTLPIYMSSDKAVEVAVVLWDDEGVGIPSLSSSDENELEEDEHQESENDKESDEDTDDSDDWSVCYDLD